MKETISSYFNGIVFESLSVFIRRKIATTKTTAIKAILRDHPVFKINVFYLIIANGIVRINFIFDLRKVKLDFLKFMSVKVVILALKLYSVFSCWLLFCGIYVWVWLGLEDNFFLELFVSYSFFQVYSNFISGSVKTVDTESVYFQYFEHFYILIKLRLVVSFAKNYAQIGTESHILNQSGLYHFIKVSFIDFIVVVDVKVHHFIHHLGIDWIHGTRTEARNGRFDFFQAISHFIVFVTFNRVFFVELGNLI